MQKPLLLLIFAAFVSALSAQEWVQKASLPDNAIPRNHPVTFSIDGIGYLTTGYIIDGSQYEQDMYRYDPVADTWTELNDFPGASRGFSYGIATGGKGYMGFGVTDTAVLNDMWAYDPATDTWTQKASCPCLGRTHPAFVETNGKIYVGLGGSIQGNLNDFWAYDIATDTWQQRADFPSHKRHHPFYFSIGDYVYVGFGHGTVNVNGFVVYNDFFRYDPATNVWEKMADFPGEARVAGTQFTYNGKGYVLHGEGALHQTFNTGEFWEYEPAMDTWKQLEDMPGGGRWAPGTFVIDNTVYATCGSDVSYTDLKDTWAYTFTTSSATTPAEAAIPVVYPNPVTQRIFVEGAEASAYILQNVSGNQVQAGTYAANGINVQTLPAGIYWLKISSDRFANTLKVVKQ
jgi:N-acetylneuraminic acid mutarotase